MFTIHFQTQFNIFHKVSHKEKSYRERSCDNAWKCFVSIVWNNSPVNHFKQIFTHSPRVVWQSTIFIFNLIHSMYICFWNCIKLSLNFYEETESNLDLNTKRRCSNSMKLCYRRGKVIIVFNYCSRKTQ